MTNSQKNKPRYDLQLITDLVKKDSKVLDIGCGNGDLLQLLSDKKNCDARGIEISSHLVSKSLMRGLSVIQGDGEKDLQDYPDRSFDYAILSHTIQATKRPDIVIEEMLRVADKIIVSLPNFANFRNRIHLFFKGTMPVNKALPYQWYETPNIHFCSIKDFKKLCRDLNIKVIQEKYLIKNRPVNYNFTVNLFSDYGIFLIEKDQYATSSNPALVKENRQSNANLQLL